MERDVLYSIIFEICGGHPKITDSTRIYHDLLISGDDAGELLAKIQGRFGTKFDGMDFHAYFPDETDSLIWAVARFFGVKCRKKELTVSHLLAVIQKMKWFDP